MMYFKKKALSLVLASVLTAASAFGAGQYKDKLSELEFKEVSGNNVELVLKTNRMLDINLTPRKIDSETYVIMLSEVDGTGAPTPDISKVNGYIKNVSVNTRAYSDTSKGYTKITIKTFGRTNLTSSNEIFEPSTKSENSQPIVPAVPLNTISKDPVLKQDSIDSAAESPRPKESQYKDLYGNKNLVNKTAVEQGQIPPEGTGFEQAKSPAKNYENENENIDSYAEHTADTQIKTKTATPSTVPAQDGSQKYLLILGIVGIIITSIFIYLKGRDKLENVIGEKLEIDIEDEEKKKKTIEDTKKPSKSNIKSTIKKLDSLYPNRTSAKLNTKIDATSEASYDIKEEVEEPLNIVDLDELFKEQQSSSSETDESSDALEEFLSGFSFEGLDDIENESSPEYKFDEKTYDEIMSSDIKFSREDIECFKKLLSSEVNAETIQNLGKYLVTNPITPVNKKTAGLLESLVTEYSIYRNITFTEEDIDILRKLMSVEIDRDFVNNLKIDHKQTVKMENDIKHHETKTKKPSKIMTLNVKNELPNLEEELLKQGNKPIKCEVKPQTVYFKEGYEYTKLKVTSMPNLENELKKVDLSKLERVENEIKPDLQDAEYSSLVDIMKIPEELPDLKDAIKNPEKYSKEEIKETVNEGALLNSLNDVEFKPLDDENKDFEVLNESEPEMKSDDILAEISDEKIYEELHDEIDISEEIQASTELPNKISRPKHEQKRVTTTNGNTEELIKRIEEAKLQRAQKRESLKRNEEIRSFRHKTHEAIVKNNFIKCNLNGQNFDIKSSVALTDNTGCHFAKSEEGYAVLCYEGNNLRIIKEYKETKSEKIQARLSDTLPDGNKRFLIRIGTNKFVVDVNGDKLSFVMDLC